MLRNFSTNAVAVPVYFCISQQFGGNFTLISGTVAVVPRSGNFFFVEAGYEYILFLNKQIPKMEVDAI